MEQKEWVEITKRLGTATSIRQTWVSAENFKGGTGEKHGHSDLDDAEVLLTVCTGSLVLAGTGLLDGEAVASSTARYMEYTWNNRKRVSSKD